MFGKFVGGKKRLLKTIDRDRLPIIYKEYPFFVDNDKKVYLWDYVKINDIGGTLEIRFLKFITDHERYFAFSILCVLYHFTRKLNYPPAPCLFGKSST